MIQAKIERLIDTIVNDVLSTKDEKKLEYLELLFKAKAAYLTNKRYELKQQKFKDLKGF